MDSIQLTLNIEKTELIILIGMLSMLIIALVWLVAWFVKTGRQNKTLRCIDDKLVPQQCIYAKSTEKIRDEILKKEQKQENKDKELNVSETQTEILCKHDRESEDVDVLEEIQKMLLEMEKADGTEKPLKEHYNKGNSGKIYSREDIETLITD